MNITPSTNPDPNPLSAYVVLIAALIAMLSAGCGPSTPPRPKLTATPVPPDADVKIIAVGDSLTEGFGVDPEDAYPARLEQVLRNAGYAATVVNAGVSGETSTGTLQRIDWVLRQEPDVIVLAIGGNDGLRGIDPALTASNIDRLVAEIQAAGAVVVLAGMEMVQNMGEEYTTRFRAIYPDVAERRGAILMPFLLEGVATDPTLNQADFIHPTADGYAVVVDNLLPYVEQAIARAQQTR